MVFEITEATVSEASPEQVTTETPETPDNVVELKKAEPVVEKKAEEPKESQLQRNSRVTACAADLEILLKKHGCELEAEVLVTVNGNVPTVRIRAIPGALATH